LVAHGHEVTLFASADAHTSARLCPTTQRSLRRQMTGDELINVAPYLHLAMLSTVYQRAAEFDLIHSHVDHLTFPFTRLTRTPTLTTMHGRLDCYPEVALVSVTIAQRQPLHEIPLNWVGCLSNGIALDHFPFQHDRGDYLAFVGRIAIEKRPDWAVEVARRSGLPLKVGAKVDPTDQAYWETEIAPLFQAHEVEFLGEVSEQEKAALLGSAYATIFPAEGLEPFGLVVVESLACGTPVIAMRRGAVPEVLRDGVSGFICDSVDEMVAAVARIPQLDRSACRREAQRFGASRMCESYEQIYTHLLSRTDQTSSPSNP
jgi:glycosyltransferase involved in cell wall biosynthesis